MTDFRSIKRAMYSTAMDVRAWLSVLERDVFDDDNVVVTKQPVDDQLIELHIQNADATIVGYLGAVYGASLLDDQTPYFVGPIREAENSSATYLKGVIVASTAITEQWLLKFTSTTAYSITGSISGSQGTGAIGADSASTNNDIEIKAVDWVGAAAVIGDLIVIATCKSRPIIRALSSQLASAAVINAVYSSSENKEADWAKSLRKQAIDFLKSLVDPKSDVSLAELSSEDVGRYVPVQYAIDEYGKDLTKYGTFGDDVSAFDY